MTTITATTPEVLVSGLDTSCSCSSEKETPFVKASGVFSFRSRLVGDGDDNLSVRDVMNLLKSPCDEGFVTSRKAPSTKCGRAQRRWTLAATILGSSMVFIDGTVVNRSEEHTSELQSPY